MVKNIAIALAALACAVAVFANWTYEGMWGTEGTGNGQFNGPYDLAVCQSNGWVYVADTGNHRIQYFTSTGSYLGKWGARGTALGQFRSPLGITASPSGIVYVADSQNHRIQRFTAAGGNPVEWGHEPGQNPGAFWVPYRAAISPASGNIYVVEQGNHRVQYFTPAGSYLGMWGCAGTDEGQFIAPSGVAVTAAGMVIVCDTFGNRIQYFNAAGAYRGQWGALGSAPGSFNYPYAAAVRMATSRVYIADERNDRIQYFRCANPGVAPGSLGKIKVLYQ